MSYLIDRQAVIDLLKQMRKDGDMVPWEGKDVFARIRKLPTIQPEKEQLSCEGTTSDTISRQAAIDAIANCTNCGNEKTLREYVTKHSLENGWTGGVLDALDAVQDLPPVQPEPHEGRFERKRDGVFCSVCHYGWEFITGVPAEVEREYHYCPNCGAKMKGAEHETD